nr:shikimate kinase [Taibaiella sp. KBW10]
MPGVGKSYWMKKLKRHYGCTAIDLDQFIESETGATIPELFLKSENMFRQIEQECLHKIIQQHKDESCVVSTGGGAPCFFDNMDLMLQQGVVIYLEGTPAFIHSRLTQSKIRRPMFENIAPEDRLAFIESLLAQRVVFYEKSTYSFDALSVTMANFAQLFSSLQF